jgi:phage terminase large subunit
VSVIDCGYRARPQFVPFHKRKERWAILVAHRRCGKTVASLNDLQDAALRSKLTRPRYAYIAPFYKQAKAVAFDHLRAAMHPLRQMGATTNESELRADYPNGGQVRLFGADNAESLRGLGFDGVVLDEFADFDPRVWPEVIRPTLSNPGRDGWAVFIGTPKGHNAFYDVWQRAQTDPEWYSVMLKASETGLISTEELQSARKELSEDQYLREYECSFEVSIQGAYFAKLLNEAQKQKRITRISADPILPLRVFCDIGGAGASADAMALWVCQFVDREVRVLDYIEGVGQVLAYYVNELRSRGYQNAEIVLPHDGVNANNVTGKRYEDHWRDADFDVRVIPNQGRGAAMMRIEAARRVLPMCWFNEETTQAGREALAYYHERRDEARNVGLGPEHDWSSHCADAFGLMAICYEEPRQATKPVRYTQPQSWLS